MFLGRVIIAFFLVLTVSAISLQSAFAQNQPGLWCSPARIEDGGNVCSPDPTTTCQLQNESYNNNLGTLVTGIEKTSQTGYKCLTKDIPFPAGEGGIRVNLASTFFTCPAGTSIFSGLCQPNILQDCDSCPGDGSGVGSASGAPNSGGGYSPQAGNPISIITQAKHHSVTDWASQDGRLKITRRYNSQANGPFYGENDNFMVGDKWSLNLIPQIKFEGSGFYFIHPNGRYMFAECCDSTGGYRAFRPTANRLSGGGFEVFETEVIYPDTTSNVQSDGTRIKVTDKAGVVFEFAVDVINNPSRSDVIVPDYGNLRIRDVDLRQDVPSYRPVSMTYPDGYKLTYMTRYFEEARFNNKFRYIPQVKAISDSLGRVISIDYNNRYFTGTDADNTIRGIAQAAALPVDGDLLRPAQSGHIARINLPDGTFLEYGYIGASDWESQYGVDRLMNRVNHVAGEAIIWSEEYHYEDSRWPLALTGITDAKNARISTYAYGENMRAISSEQADGVGRVTLEDVSTSADTAAGHRITRVTNALGKATDYEIERSDQQSRGYINSITGQADGDIPGDRLDFELDTQVHIRGRFGFFVTSKTDRLGRRAEYTYDARGHRTSTTYAAGTPSETMMTAQFDPETRQKMRETVDGLRTEYRRSPTGKLLGVTLTDLTSVASAPRTFDFTYDGPNVASVDGSLPGSVDTTLYDWSGPRLLSVTNPLGHVTQFSDHTAYEAPRRIIDPNGVVTTITYDARQRPTEITVDPTGRSAVTSISYDLNGQVRRIISPNGTRLDFTYDAAQRLIAVENAAGERMELTRNLMSTVTATTLSDETGAIRMQMQQVTDSLNRVVKTVLPDTDYGLPVETLTQYDTEDNPTSMTDARANNWTRSFDGLNRVVRETDPLGAQTTYDLEPQADGRNPLTKVIDARNVETTYVRNGFGEVTAEISAEAGTTTYVRDTRGLVTRMTDARGQVVDYTYDAAGRLLSERYSGAPEADVTYGYDAGQYGVGQLTSITESFGTTDYRYDALGFLIEETRSLDGQSYATGYAHDLSGEVIETIYPSGLEVRTPRDMAARITDIIVYDPETEVQHAVLMGASYHPFGPLTGAAMGDGHTLALDYDGAYRATRLRRSRNDGNLMDLTFQHDAAGDILAMVDGVRPERSQSFTYDPVSRLTRAEGGYGVLEYGYNLVGDRTSRNLTPIDGAVQSETYRYDDDSARLLEVRGGDVSLRDFAYAPSGQMIRDTRPEAEITVDLDARGRMAGVSRDGVRVADYRYDVFEQRIAKSTPDTDAVHYTYDGEGRLIAETDAATGEAIREYIWFGLTPVAVRRAGEGMTVDRCATEELDALRARLADRQMRLATVSANVTRLGDVLATRQTTLLTVTARRDVLVDRLANLSPTATQERRDALTARLATLSARVVELEAVVADVTARLAANVLRETELTEIVTRLQTVVSNREARCARLAANGDGTDIITTGEGGPRLDYIHADHLGRPAFVTDTNGAVLWDGGITTPFGVSLATMGALTQNLMFPGQYRDTETGYDDNWHRTYDPTLGRYLQADPIGLAGGLNRYAYVGGNPVSRVDPDGQFWWVLGFAAADLAWQLYKNGGRWECIDYVGVGLNLVGGGLIGKALRKVPGKEFSHWIPKRYTNRLTRAGNLSKSYRPNIDKYFGRFAKSRFNGNYVSREFHARTDSYRMRFMSRAFKNESEMFPKFMQQAARVPGWIPGSAILGGSLLTDFSPDNCECP